MSVVILLANVYILIEYQHPEDKLQAWGPKIVVVLGLSIAVLSVLMFPLDVSNTRACATSLSPSACTFTLPMETLWYAIFISNLVLVWVVIPYSVFFYEASSEL